MSLFVLEIGVKSSLVARPRHLALAPGTGATGALPACPAAGLRGSGTLGFRIGTFARKVVHGVE
jgi:hypothetical protein